MDLKRKLVYIHLRKSLSGSLGVTLPDKVDEEEETLPMCWTITFLKAYMSLTKFLRK